jgi:hypothetical protein
MENSKAKSAKSANGEHPKAALQAKTSNERHGSKPRSEAPGWRRLAIVAKCLHPPVHDSH